MANRIMLLKVIAQPIVVHLDEHDNPVCEEAADAFPLYTQADAVQLLPELRRLLDELNAAAAAEE